MRKLDVSFQPRPRRPLGNGRRWVGNGDGKLCLMERSCDIGAFHCWSYVLWPYLCRHPCMPISSDGYSSTQWLQWPPDARWEAHPSVVLRLRLERCLTPAICLPISLSHAVRDAGCLECVQVHGLETNVWHADPFGVDYHHAERRLLPQCETHRDQSCIQQVARLWRCRCSWTLMTLDAIREVKIWEVKRCHDVLDGLILELLMFEGLQEEIPDDALWFCACFLWQKGLGARMRDFFINHVCRFLVVELKFVSCRIIACDCLWVVIRRGSGAISRVPSLLCCR